MNAGVTIITDLGYGDAGKGSITDYLARSNDGAKMVVRFNGGPQASHNVVTPTGTHHAFHQFGSASLIPGVRTHLSRFMLVSPLLLWQEAKELWLKGVEDPLSLVTIDERALIITPFHEAANRIREALRGPNRHGSCGLGIGETMADSLAYPAETLTAGDLANPLRTSEILNLVRKRKLAEFENSLPSLKDYPEALRAISTLHEPDLIKDVVDFYVDLCSTVKIVKSDYLGEWLEIGPVLFEGAQGVLLDEWHGFHPYTTWSTTTNENAEQLLQEQGYNGQVTRLGLVRAYSTRHGAGPFVTENAELTESLPDARNPFNPWQHGFRVGYFDEVATRYALSVAGTIDGLVVSHLDEMIGQPNWSTCSHYRADDGKCFSEILPSSNHNLEIQGSLTQSLFGCKPVLDMFRDKPIVSNDMGEYILRIEKALGHNVVLTSSGPTARDKSRI
jgi:adenylosuccinate synthase